MCSRMLNYSLTNDFIVTLTVTNLLTLSHTSFEGWGKELDGVEEWERGMGTGV